MAKRFRDEFFRKGTPSHDSLVVFCHSDEFENILIDLLKKKGKIHEGNSNILGHEEIIQSLMKCTKEAEEKWQNARHDGISDSCSELLDQIQKEYVEWVQFWYCTESSLKQFVENERSPCNTPWPKQKKCYRLIDDDVQDICKFFDSYAYKKRYFEKYPDQEEVGDVRSIGTRCWGILTYEENQIWRFHTETEKICKSGQFIIGYIDMLYQLKTLQYYCLINHRFPPEKKFRISQTIFNLIIEVKPKLETWGPALRQIKTYIDVERDRIEKETHIEDQEIYGVIVSHDILDQEVIKLFEQEKVFFIHIPRGKLADSTEEKKGLQNYLSNNKKEKE